MSVTRCSLFYTCFNYNCSLTARGVLCVRSCTISVIEFALASCWTLCHWWVWTTQLIVSLPLHCSATLWRLTIYYLFLKNEVYFRNTSIKASILYHTGQLTEVKIHWVTTETWMAMLSISCSLRQKEWTQLCCSNLGLQILQIVNWTIVDRLFDNWTDIRWFICLLR